MLEILWHDREAVFSVDVSPQEEGEDCRWLVSCGADRFARVWRITGEDGHVEFEANLEHTSTVNAVKFASCSSREVATGADGGGVQIWQVQSGKWTVRSILRGHVQDVQDIAWSSDGGRLATASVDNVVMVWDTKRAKVLKRLCGHLSYVQGVSFDPLEGFLASQSSDRTMKIYAQKRAYTCVGTSNSKLFLEDSMCYFFRRLSWSPDGSFLACPGGLTTDSKPGVHIFARGEWSTPFATMSGFNRPAVVVRFCPIIFHKPDTDAVSTNVFSLPHTVVFAVATTNMVVLFDTNTLSAIATAVGLHYEPITDLTWSSDGRLLYVSSIDGYVSVLRFEEGELGRPLNPSRRQTKTLQNDKLVWNETVKSIEVRDTKKRTISTEKKVLGRISQGTSHT